jgi:hypothetical protein
MRNINNKYKWVSNKNLKIFRGKWIAVYNKKILSSGKYADDVVKEAKKKIKVSPFLIKVPFEGYISN